MSNSGGLDRAYILARHVLLDALEALKDQLPAVTLVGAQAIYLHTGEADLAVLPYTTDADLALDPTVLVADPKLDEAMRGAGFTRHPTDVGIWLASGGSQVDLLVPAAVGGGGRRAARLGGHGAKTAIKVHGLEGALVDRAPMTIEALDPAIDNRRLTVMVAGPAGLLVAKLHKVAERRGQPRRQDDKDALDVYRLLRYMEPGFGAAQIRKLLDSPVARDVTKEALDYLDQLFEGPESVGSQMAGRSVAGIGDPVFVAAAAATLASDLLRELKQLEVDGVADVLDAETLDRIASAIGDAALNLSSRIDNIDGAKAAMRGAGEALERASAELREAAKRRQNPDR